jgi:hypothetical protein
MSSNRSLLAAADVPLNQSWILPALAPVRGSSTVIEFGTTWPGVSKFRLDVVGLPVAVPGRTDTNPIVEGATPVTLATIAVAPLGTGLPVPITLPGFTIGIDPVTSSSRGESDTSAPLSPAPIRVSSTRVGLTGTNDDDVPPASAANSPPAPSVTATAAPIAAHRVRHRPVDCLVISM